MARMRSAAKTKLPFSTGTTSRRCGLCAAISPRDLLGSRGDLVFGKQDGDIVAVNMDGAHGAAFEPISSSRAKRISTFWAASGGEATRVEKLVASPGRNGRNADSTVQA